MGQSLPKPGLRPFLPADVPPLAEIFRASIEELTGDDYSEAQQEAWASRADDANFEKRLLGRADSGRHDGWFAAGFCVAEGQHPHRPLFRPSRSCEAGRRRDACYDAVEKLATARGAQRLTADVSDTAMPFFQKRGFQPQRRNTVTIGDEWLANTTMDKLLAAAAEGSKPS